MKDDGVLYICNLVDTAENGNKPKEVLQIVNKHWFEERVIGYGRFYTAQGVNQKVDRLVRVNYDNNIRIGQYAVLGNGEQFRIDMVANGQEEFERQKMVEGKYYRQYRMTGLRYTDITMSRVENNYDVETH